MASSLAEIIRWSRQEEGGAPPAAAREEDDEGEGLDRRLQAEQLGGGRKCPTAAKPRRRLQHRLPMDGTGGTMEDFQSSRHRRGDRPHRPLPAAPAAPAGGWPPRKRAALPLSSRRRPLPEVGRPSVARAGLRRAAWGRRWRGMWRLSRRRRERGGEWAGWEGALWDGGGGARGVEAGAEDGCGDWEKFC
jgi:hypothetical protein